MGVDIHMYLVEDKTIIAKDLYDGRNSEWFDNLLGHGWDKEYDDLPECYDNIELPEKIIKDLDVLGYYGLHIICVDDYLEWYEEKKPYLKAGWLSKYEIFLLKEKGIKPDEPRHYLDSDVNINDYEFITYEDHTPDTYVVRQIKELVEPQYRNKVYLVYYFDR